MKNVTRKSLVVLMLTMSLSSQANDLDITFKEKERTEQIYTLIM